MTNEMTTEKPMSNEEVIEVLKGIVFGGFDRTTRKERQALGLAIKALEEKPQGEWKHMTVGNTNIEFIICSNCSCGCPSYSYIKEGETEEKVQLCETTFCPNCGRKMKGRFAE